MKISTPAIAVITVLAIAFAGTANAKDRCENELIRVKIVAVKELSEISHAMRTVSDCGEDGEKCIYHNEIYQTDITIKGYEVTYKLRGVTKKMVLGYDPKATRLKVRRQKCALDKLKM